MAYNGPSNVKDNFNRFQRQATINLTKHMQELAKKTQKNIREVIAEKLLQTYKDNVKMSYKPRGDGSYVHTGTLLEHIHVVIEEEPGRGRDRVKIVLDENVVYKQLSKRTVGQVYKFLTEGTEGEGKHYGVYRYKNSSGNIEYGYNYPTPPHEFELWTQLEMKSFLESLKSDIEGGKYSK